MTYNIEGKTIGEVWVKLVSMIEKLGSPIDEEGKELTNVIVQFPGQADVIDHILAKYADQAMIKNMEFVFFNQGEDVLGHSYHDLMQGPLRCNDFTDIIQLLKHKTVCKRATLTITPGVNGKVPCINVVNFLIRNNALHLSYFARGQDAYKKFFADAIAITKMQKIVAQQLNISLGDITGFIASAHNYYEDKAGYNTLLRNNLV